VSWLAQDFAEGGVAMFPIFAFGFLGALGGIVAFILGLAVAQRRTLWVSVAMMALSFAAPAVGAIGYALALSNIERALVGIDPSMLEPLRMVGTAEALTSIEYGLGAGLLPFCLGLALFGVGLTRLRPE
jgi:hypothetical protein